MNSLRSQISNFKSQNWPRLRPATNADCEPVRRLVFAVLAEYGLKPDPGCTDADLADLERSYLARGGVFRVLEGRDGSIVGSYGLYPTEPGVCELRKMYLHRDHRGKGLGCGLLEDALTRAKELGFRRITLETASVLKEAIRLYERYGFTPARPDHLSPPLRPSLRARSVAADGSQENHLPDDTRRRNYPPLPPT